MAVKILTLSNKPAMLVEAMASVQAQTRKAEHIVMRDTERDWQGRYPPAVYYNETARACAMDDYISWLSDDDLLMPNYVETLAGYLDAHPEVGCCYGFAHHYIYDGDGIGKLFRILPWDGLCSIFDAHHSPVGMLDGGQIMVRRSVLDAIGPHYAPEDADPSTARISDGILMARIAAVCGIYPVSDQPVFVAQCRTNPWSAHCRTNTAGGIDAVDWRQA